MRDPGICCGRCYAEGNKNYGATSAPLVVKDKVLVGTSGGDDGVRGFVAAYDAETGKQVWRFWTIPGPGEFGSESWPGELYKRGGGTTWMPGTYDPELNTIYWTTSNPALISMVARARETICTPTVFLHWIPIREKLKWYFQFTPHDLFDYDATETPVLVGARTFRGRLRKLLVQSKSQRLFLRAGPRRRKISSAFPFVEKLSGPKGIDAQGRPIRTGMQPTAEGTRICPGWIGATNWYSPSYSPSTTFSISWRTKLRSLFSKARGIFRRKNILFHGRSS
jgi:alcohol dehydrogenase (cytochrome c)